MLILDFCLYYSRDCFQKTFLKTKRREKNKYRKIALLARSKLNSIEYIISKALVGSDIFHEEFKLVINEEKDYFRLKESIKAKDDQMDGMTS